jgi:hypothetical protein
MPTKQQVEGLIERLAQKWKDDGYWESFNCLF